MGKLRQNSKGWAIFLVLFWFLVTGCSSVSSLPTVAANLVQEEKSSAAVFFNDPTEKTRDATLQNVILSAVDEAKERIYVVTYNFTDTKTRDALIRAARTGVDVRLVIHAENADSDVVQSLIKAKVKVQPSLSNGLMHAKFIVIDQGVTISGSANMTPGSFFYDNNFLFLIRSAEVNQIFCDEFNEMFLDKKFGENSPKTDAPGLIKLDDGTKVYVRFSPDDKINDTLTSLIKNAKKNVYMFAYSFASDDLAKALVQQYDAGVDVEVLFEKDKAYKDTGGEAEFLKRSGIPIHMDGNRDALMHEKAIILDESVVVAGSYNFTRSADTRNDEQVLILSNPEIVKQFLSEWNKLVSESE